MIRPLMLAACALLVPVLAQAAPITYSFTSEGDFTLGGTAYTAQAFTFALHGDTDAVVLDTSASPFIFFTNTASSSTFEAAGGSVSVSGLVAYLESFGTAADVNTVGFSYPAGRGLQLGTSALDGYALAGNAGPISGPLVSFGSSAGPYATSGGDLVLAIDSVGPVTFQATLVPIPPAGLLLASALGLLGLLGVYRPSACLRRGGACRPA